jgi:hypothetical protein
MISKRRQRRSCTRKGAYSTLKGAECVAEKARAGTGELIIAYSCEFCGRFHIGHLSQTNALHIKRNRQVPPDTQEEGQGQRERDRFSQ